MEPAKTDRNTFRVIQMENTTRTSSAHETMSKPDAERDDHTWRCVRPNKVRCATG